LVVKQWEWHLLLPFFYLKTEKMKVEISLNDQVDELMNLLDLTQQQINQNKYVDALETLHSMYELLEIYEF
jgi:hypothetical protein